MWPEIGASGFVLWPHPRNHVQPVVPVPRGGREAGLPAKLVAPHHAHRLLPPDVDSQGAVAAPEILVAALRRSATIPGQVTPARPSEGERVAGVLVPLVAPAEHHRVCPRFPPPMGG